MLVAQLESELECEVVRMVVVSDIDVAVACTCRPLCVYALSWASAAGHRQIILTA